jgi:hypothetical protein
MALRSLALESVHHFQSFRLALDRFASRQCVKPSSERALDGRPDAHLLQQTHVEIFLPHNEEKNTCTNETRSDCGLVERDWDGDHRVAVGQRFKRRVKTTVENR